MARVVKYKRMPFDSLGKKLFAFLLGELASIWIVAAAAIMLLPTVVPMQFNWSGVATSSGLNSTLIAIALVFSIVPIVILIVSLLRFRIVNYHPYLLNTPSFYNIVKRVPSSRRSYWVNKYFETLLVAGVYLSGILLILILEIYTAASKDYLNGYLGIIAPLIAIVAVCVLLIILIKDMYKKMALEANRKRRR